MNSKIGEKAALIVMDAVVAKECSERKCGYHGYS